MYLYSTFHPHLPVHGLTDVVLKFVDLSVIKLSWVLKVLCRGLRDFATAVDAANCILLLYWARR